MHKMTYKILPLVFIFSNCITLSCSICETLYSFGPPFRLMNYATRSDFIYTLYCSDINLDKETQLNQEFNSSNEIFPLVKVLRIKQSNISRIYNNTFEGFQHLKEVSLTNVSLHKIDPNVFVNWINLSDLVLTYNELTAIDFQLPPNIINLNISHNNISHINVLQNYNYLSTIDLSYNSIISIENFGPFDALINLDLSHNNLSSLANITWKNGQMLNSFYGSHNNLTHITENIESLFIKYLDLSYNEISTFNCTNVTESINLSYNNIEEICNISRTMNKIDFSNNEITHIYEHTFKNLEKLEYLNLSSNYIETKNIYPGAFRDLINLEFLDLSDNFLSKLPKGLFYHLENLRTLYIAMNFIEHIDHGTFTGLNNLHILDISVNRIDDLDAIYSLKYLHELNIMDNNFLDQLDVDQIAKHLPELLKIKFNLYRVSCEQLSIYLLEFRVKKITVEKGNIRYVNNLNGIYCNSDSDFKIKKQESNDQRMGYIVDYLSRISVALIVILVVLVFVIILISFTLYRVYTKHRNQTEIDRNLHTCSLKLLSENDPMN